MRRDAQVIKAIYKLYGAEKALYIQSLPFFMVPDRDKAPYRDENENILQEFKINPCDKYALEILPFTKFAIFINTADYLIIEVVNEKNWHISVVVDPSTSAQISRELGTGTILLYDIALKPVDNPRYVEAAIDLYAVPTTGGTELLIGAQQEEMQGSGTAQAIITYIIGILAYFNWAEAQHLIEVTPQASKRDARTQKHGNKKPWVRNDMPHFIYLDGPPATTAQHHGTGTGAGKRGHNRRAHWRTLRDDRFKDHPNYMKPVRIKSTWVGPKEWQDEGSTYKIHQEE